MAPVKNKKNKSVATKPTSKKAIPEKKKRLKNGEKTANVDESTSEQVVSNEKLMEDEKVTDAKEPAPAPKVRKPCTWLKLDRLVPPIGSKSSLLQSCKQEKDAKSISQVQSQKDNKRKRPQEGEERTNNYNRNSDEKHIGSRVEKKEKRIVNDRHEDTRNRDDDESGKSLGGLIFMCNAKTKPDCFKYQVMGIMANKKDVVMGIEPGLKLFLYDYDLKLLYGIFEASSAGGLKLEPTAFGGGFPAQVRFIVHKDCSPLPESMFKKAIKDTYDERTRKFKTELTVKQVKNLMDMFRPTPRLHPNGKPVVQDHSPIIRQLQPTEESQMGQRYLNKYGMSENAVVKPVPIQEPRFITEQEYRNYGLRQGNHHLPQTAAGDDVSHTRGPYKLDQELKQILRNPSTDPFFPSEKEYRTFGLRAHQQIIPNGGPVKDTNVSYNNPYDESTTSLVNRYLAIPVESSYPMAGRVPYVNYQNHPIRMIPDGERASYSLGEQYSLHAAGSRETSVAPASQRYAFAGPSPSHSQQR